jgi:collagenase-like PrtC family protease
LESDEDWLEKARAIFAGEEYDTRVSIPVDFSDDELLKYMTMAHERDMTFNQFIEEALREAMKDFESNPKAFKDKYSSKLPKN